MLFVKGFLNDLKIVILKLFSKDFDIDLIARILFKTELEGPNKIMKNTILQNCKPGFATYVGSSSIL